MFGSLSVMEFLTTVSQLDSLQSKSTSSWNFLYGFVLAENDADVFVQALVKLVITEDKRMKDFTARSILLP